MSGFDRADFLFGGFSYFTQNSGEFEQRRGTRPAGISAIPGGYVPA